MLPDLTTTSPSAALAQPLRQTVLELPPSARLLYLFDLSARASGWLRLEFYFPSLTDLIDYVARSLGQTAHEQLDGVYTLAKDGDRYHLSLDLREDCIDSRIGLEISYRRLPHREPRWHALLDRLTAAGLCHFTERDAIFRWPGTDTKATAGAWPGLKSGHCVRCLSHVKLVTRPNQDPQAKCYLLFQHLQSPSTIGRRLHERPMRETQI